MKLGEVIKKIYKEESIKLGYENRFFLTLRKKLAPLITQKLGLPNPVYKAHGKSAAAFIVGDKIMKITNAHNDAQLFNNIKKQQYRYLPEVYEVYSVNVDVSDGNLEETYYIILMEKLRTIRDELTFEKLDDAWQSYRRKTRTHSEDFFEDVDFIRNLAGYTTDWEVVKLGANLYESIREAREVGAYHICDIYENNIGINQYNNYVILDFGESECEIRQSITAL